LWVFPSGDVQVLKWSRTGKSDRLMWKRQWLLFHKIQDIFRPLSSGKGLR
jgi:hypothetical protein